MNASFFRVAQHIDTGWLGRLHKCAQVRVLDVYYGSPKPLFLGEISVP